MVDTYQSVWSWAPIRASGIVDLWNNFLTLWKDKDDRDFLITAIHWYVEANKLSGFTEGAIILVQTALELVYNWLVVENKKLLIGRDAENITAANKIRLLISQLNLTFDFPDSFKHLSKIHEISNAPEAFVQIRNAIVHSQEEKRKKLSEIPPTARYEALSLGVWYLELSLLKILDYKGNYQNRCSRKPDALNEIVPWYN